MKKLGILGILIIFVCFGQAVYADTSREQTFNMLHQAFEAQLSLTESYRTMEEVKEILSPYFTEEYMELFLAEHLYQDENGYIILGSDTFEYIVPFFTFDKSTKVIQKDNNMLVYEYFPPSYEGGVVWEGHYEGLHLKKLDNGWKIGEYYSDVEKPELEIDQ